MGQSAWESVIDRLVKHTPSPPPDVAGAARRPLLRIRLPRIATSRTAASTVVLPQADAVGDVQDLVGDDPQGPRRPPRDRRAERVLPVDPRPRIGDAGATQVALSADDVADLDATVARLGVHGDRYNDQHMRLVGK
ncbi:hypothetical protein [Streptomyces vastus]|uniref:Uncharacterized protein n=1 Tax=Streptomyces vastus TaxID=285451 RepID=A0ABP6EHJ1_9ACTN